MSSNPQWWDRKAYPDPFKEVYGIAHKLRDDQLEREKRALTNLCYYGAEPMLGLSLRDYAQRGRGERSSVNVVKNIINSTHAEITQNRPRMMVVSEGGTHDIQKAAKGLDKLIEGQTVEDGQEEISPLLCKDALCVGDGIEKIFDNHITDRVECERLMNWEVVVPMQEAYYGRPMTFYHVTQVDKGVLMAEYDDLKEEIDKSASADTDPFFSFDRDSDLVTVVEGIRLPSICEWGDPDNKDDYRPATEDGRHFICTSKARLYDAPWKRKQSPYFFLKWEIPQVGFWSTSLIDDLRGEQAMVNRLDRFIKESMARAGMKILIDNNAGVLNSSIDDLIGTIVRGNFTSGAKPEWATPGTVHPEFFQHMQWRIDQMYQQNGTNQLAAQSMVPAQLTSGKSIKAYEQSKSRRFIDFAKRYETFHRDAAEYKTVLMRDVFMRTGKYAVVYHGKKAIELVDFNKFKGLQPNQYRIRVFPTSALPTTPAGRIATLEDWKNSGLITTADFKRLADFPDIEEFADLDNASHDIIKMMIDAMLEDGKDQKPEPLMDLELAMHMATNAYLLARVRGWYPKANLEKLTVFVAWCSKMLEGETIEPPPPALGAGPAGAPPELPPMPGGEMPPMGAPPQMPPPMNGAPN